MRQSIEKTWKLLEVTVEQMPEMGVCESAFSEYDRVYRKMYKNIQERYMKDSSENLDRHKEAAIAIISIIKANAIVYKGEIKEGQIFIGSYMTAASVGVTLMIQRLNSLLAEKNLKTINRLWYPDALACDTSYFSIFYRNLYFSNNNEEWGLNPLDIAERLFILEYVTLEKNGIDPHVLKEESQNC